MRRLALVLVCVAGVLGASAAGAQTERKDDNVTRARALGHEAAERLIAKDYAGAIDRVTQAEDLFHAPTHLLILGEAQEGLGRLAEAMTTFERLVAEPLPVSASDGFLKAQETARQHLRDLGSRVPSLLVVVRGAPASEVATTVDGRALTTSAGAAVRLDPGAHEVRVTAPGFTLFERTITLPERGGVVVLEASLERVGGAPPPDPDGPRGRPEEAPKSPSRAPVFVAFGAGAAGLVVGAVTGALSLSMVSDLKDRCPNDECTAADQPDIDQAGTLATVSTIGFGVGAAGVVVGVLLLALLPGESSPSAGASSSAARVTPWIGLGAAGVRGSF